jgi:hypothetical protein
VESAGTGDVILESREADPALRIFGMTTFDPG